jgi:hypothetical protein
MVMDLSLSETQGYRVCLTGLTGGSLGRPGRAGIGHLIKGCTGHPLSSSGRNLKLTHYPKYRERQASRASKRVSVRSTDSRTLTICHQIGPTLAAGFPARRVARPGQCTGDASSLQIRLLSSQLTPKIGFTLSEQCSRSLRPPPEVTMRNSLIHDGVKLKEQLQSTSPYSLICTDLRAAPLML